MKRGLLTRSACVALYDRMMFVFITRLLSGFQEFSSFFYLITSITSIYIPLILNRCIYLHLTLIFCTRSLLSPLDRSSSDNSGSELN